MTQFQITSKRGRALLGGCVALGLIGSGFNAADAASKAEQSRTAVLQAVMDCRAIGDQTARLACFDTAVGKMVQAEKSGDIVVVDRQQVREAKRAAFGLEIPHFTLFDRGDKPEQIDRISGVAESAYVNAAGKWVVVLEDGAKWVQIDSETPYSDPHKGSKVDIRKASLGSYLMNIDSHTALRVQRIN
jgi:hypothetical protein